VASDGPDIAREIETKYDIAPDFAMPSLAGRERRVDVDTVRLASTYYDTGDHDLLRYRLTLRRRLGDVDTGWQLKVPGAGERTELRWPATEERPRRSRPCYARSSATSRSPPSSAWT